MYIRAQELEVLVVITSCSTEIIIKNIYIFYTVNRQQNVTSS
jgi:hypothetical protein